MSASEKLPNGYEYYNNQRRRKKRRNNRYQEYKSELLRKDWCWFVQFLLMILCSTLHKIVL